jgi:UDP-glucose 4-epimerase
MSNILIVGASGYVGARLSYLLAQDGNKVTALCYPNIPDHTAWVSMMENVIVGDITSNKTIDELTNTVFDKAIYLVSLDHHDSNKAPEFVNSINVLPVWNLLDAFRRKNTLKQFIYFSTIHVYGKFPNQIIDESFLPSPMAPYGLTHLMVEDVCNMFNNSSDIHCINIRMSNSYGSPFFHENNCWWLVVNDLCRTAYFDKKIVLKSDGSALRDFIHYKDVFKSINCLLNSSPNEDGNVYHLSSGKTLSILNLAETIRNVFLKKYGKMIPIEFAMDYEAKRIADKEFYTISNQKIQSQGFMQEMELEAGILELFEYFESNERI